MPISIVSSCTSRTAVEGDLDGILAADTDVGNRPMAAAFERAGYHVFAVRMVATAPPGV